MIIRFGACEVDLDRVELRVDGVPAPVEPQVFDVLAYLVEHRDRLVPKEELLDNVWGDRFVGESALTSRIKSLRRVLGDSGREQSVIKTVHRRGYRFVAEIETVETVETAENGATAENRAMVETVGSAGTADDDDWPIVGRHAEAVEIDQRFHDPSCHGVLITGGAGLGKTRLALRCLERAAAEGWPTAHASGHRDARSVPLACIAHLLPDDVLGAAEGDGELVRAIVFQRARSAIEELAAERRLVLLVDNVDQVDELSNAVLGSLIVSGTVFAIMTQRTTGDEALALEDLIRGGRVAHLDVAPLDDSDLDVMLYRALAGPIEHDTLTRLTSLAEGRPGVLMDLVESCLADHSLERRAGVWQLVGPVQPTVGHPARGQLVVTSLDPAAVAGAEVLALAGDLGLDTATELIGADVLDQLDGAGLIALDGGGEQPRVALVQPHVRLLLTEGLGALRTRRIKSRLVDALSRSPYEVDRVRVVRWMIETGDAPDDEETLQATRLAIAAGDPATADILLGHLAGSSDRAKQLEAELCFRRGQMDRAEELLTEIDLAAVDAVTAATVVRRRAAILFHVRGRAEEAIELLVEHRDRAGEPARTMLTTHLVAHRAFTGEVDEVLSEVDSLPTELDLVQRLEVDRSLGHALLLSGRITEALDVLDEHERRARALPRSVTQTGEEVAMAVTIAAHAARGDLGRAGALVRRHVPIGRRTLLAWLPMAAARVELGAGRPRSARELLLTPLAAVRSQNLLHAEPLMLALLAQASLHLDDLPMAKRQGDQAAEGIGRLAGQLDFSLVFSLADVWIGIGDEERAVEHLLPAAARAREIGAVLTEAELLATAALAGVSRDVAERVAELAPSIEGDLWPVRSRHVRAIATGDDPDRFAEIASAYDRLGYRYLAERTARR